MSGNSSTFRRAAAASCAVAEDRGQLRGVVRRQSQRIAPRSTAAVTVAASHARAAAASD